MFPDFRRDFSTRRGNNIRELILRLSRSHIDLAPVQHALVQRQAELVRCLVRQVAKGDAAELPTSIDTSVIDHTQRLDGHALGNEMLADLHVGSRVRNLRQVDRIDRLRWWLGRHSRLRSSILYWSSGLFGDRLVDFAIVIVILDPSCHHTDEHIVFLIGIGISSFLLSRMPITGTRASITTFTGSWSRRHAVAIVVANDGKQ